LTPLINAVSVMNEDSILNTAAPYRMYKACINFEH